MGVCGVWDWLGLGARGKLGRWRLWERGGGG